MDNIALRSFKETLTALPFIWVANLFSSANVETKSAVGALPSVFAVPSEIKLWSSTQ